MIINIAGTSGAGKSFLINRLFDWVEDEEGVIDALYEPGGRRMPVGYELKLSGRRKKVFVIGSYENPTGGCDTFKNLDEIFDIIRRKHGVFDIIYEGLFVMNMTRGPALCEEFDDIYIIHLTTPLKACLRSIDVRRSERGAGKLPQDKNVRGNYVRARNYTMRMRDAGAEVIHADREKAFEELRGLL